MLQRKYWICWPILPNDLPLYTLNRKKFTQIPDMPQTFIQWSRNFQKCIWGPCGHNLFRFSLPFLFVLIRWKNYTKIQDGRGRERHTFSWQVKVKNAVYWILLVDFSRENKIGFLESKLCSPISNIFRQSCANIFGKMAQIRYENPLPPMPVLANNSKSTLHQRGEEVSLEKWFFQNIFATDCSCIVYIQSISFIIFLLDFNNTYIFVLVF